MEPDNNPSSKQKGRFGQLKHFVFAFLLAAAGYFLLFHVIEGARVANNPWRVTFTNETDGTAMLLVEQDALASKPCRVIFSGAFLPGRTNGETLDFGTPRVVPFDVPFGRCVFLDTTFLPGTVVFELFNHTVELMPRALIVDHKDHEWRKGVTEVRVEEK